MKKPLEMLRVSQEIWQLGPQMGGVFSASDLASLIGGGSDLKNARAMQRLVREKIVVRVRKGIYVAPGFDPWVLASRLAPRSYITMESVLAKEGLTGTVPSGLVSAAQAARPRAFEAGGVRIVIHSLSKELLFGIERLPSGVRAADSEKAFLDLLYFYQKGARFPIDPLRDVRTEALDRKRLQGYLKHYRNPKFVAFAKGVIDGQS